MRRETELSHLRLLQALCQQQAPYPRSRINKVPTGVTEEETLLEGLRCGFGGPANQRGSVGTRGLPTLSHIQQVAEGFRDSPLQKHCRKEREKVPKTWSESITESCWKAPGQQKPFSISR